MTAQSVPGGIWCLPGDSLISTLHHFLSAVEPQRSRGAGTPTQGPVASLRLAGQCPAMWCLAWHIFAHPSGTHGDHNPSPQQNLTHYVYSGSLLLGRRVSVGAPSQKFTHTHLCPHQTGPRKPALSSLSSSLRAGAQLGDHDQLWTLRVWATSGRQIWGIVSGTSSQ